MVASRSWATLRQLIQYFQEICRRGLLLFMLAFDNARDAADINIADLPAVTGKQPAVKNFAIFGRRKIGIAAIQHQPVGTIARGQLVSRDAACLCAAL